MTTPGSIVVDAQGRRLLDGLGRVSLHKGDGTTCGCDCSPCLFHYGKDPYGCTYSPSSTAAMSYSIVVEYPDGSTHTVANSRPVMPVLGGLTNNSAGLRYFAGGDPRNVGLADTHSPGFPGFYAAAKRVENSDAGSFTYNGDWQILDRVASPKGGGRFLEIRLTFVPVGSHCLGFTLANLFSGGPNDLKGVAATQSVVIDKQADGSGATQATIKSLTAVSVAVSDADDAKCPDYQRCADWNADAFTDSISVSFQAITVHPLSFDAGNGNTAPDGGTHTLTPLLGTVTRVPSNSRVDFYEVAPRDRTVSPSIVPNDYNQEWNVAIVDLRRQLDPDGKCRWQMDLSGGWNRLSGNVGGDNFFATYHSTTEAINGTYKYVGGARVRLYRKGSNNFFRTFEYEAPNRLTVSAGDITVSGGGVLVPYTPIPTWPHD